MFVAPSTHEIHEVALIQSEIVHLTEDERGKCLYFSYFMHGSRVGELKVLCFGKDRLAILVILSFYYFGSFCVSFVPDFWLSRFKGLLDHEVSFYLLSSL